MLRLASEFNLPTAPAPLPAEAAVRNAKEYQLTAKVEEASINIIFPRAINQGSLHSSPRWSETVKFGT